MRASLAIAAVLLAAAPVTAAKVPQVSWGKLGVTFEQYRADAIACGRAGYYRDVSDTNAARVFREASSQLDTITDSGAARVNMWAPGELDASGGAASISRTQEAPASLVEVGARIDQVVESTRPEEQLREVGRLLRSTVEECLVARGYHRFQLTASQVKRLHKLRAGTPERQAYLYGLATNAEVLRVQAI